MMTKMLKNLLPKVNAEGEVTLLGRIGDAMIETEAADCGFDNEATHDLPSPLLSQVENVRMKAISKIPESLVIIISSQPDFLHCISIYGISSF